MYDYAGASQIDSGAFRRGENAGPDGCPDGGWDVLVGAIGACGDLGEAASALVDAVLAGVRGTKAAVRTPAGANRSQIAADLSVAAARLTHIVERLHVAASGLAASERVHELDGMGTIGLWLALHHGITRRDAYRLLRAGVVTERFGEVRTAFEAGELTLGHLDAIAKIIPQTFEGDHLDAAIDAIREIQPLLLDAASRCSLNRFEGFCHNVRDRLDQDGPGDPSTDPSHITLSQTFNGRWHLHGDLTPDDGALLATILHDLINRQLHTAQSDSGKDPVSENAATDAAHDAHAADREGGCATDGKRATRDAGRDGRDTTAAKRDGETARQDDQTGGERDAKSGGQTGGEHEANTGGQTDGEAAGGRNRGTVAGQEADPPHLPTMAQRRASALRDALLAAAGLTRPGRVGAYIHIDLDKLNRADEGLAALFTEHHGEPDVSGPAHTETNLDITDETLWALLANADVIPTFTRDGTPLSYGRTRRLAPDVLRRALAHRDRGCRFPGCERNTIGCDLHHLVHYSDGGTTDPNGLANVCPGHHHRHHNGDAVISGNPNQPLHATRPDGTTITNTPRYKQPPRP